MGSDEPRSETLTPGPLYVFSEEPITNPQDLAALERRVRRPDSLRAGEMDYRVERLFIRLAQPIPGLDPIRAVHPAEFAWHTTNFDADSLGLTR